MNGKVDVEALENRLKELAGMVALKTKQLEAAMKGLETAKYWLEEGVPEDGSADTLVLETVVDAIITINAMKD